MTSRPLEGIAVVSLATNLPGPAATAGLVRLGANVIKVEPPAGDAMSMAAPAYYGELAAGQEIVIADLKTTEGQEQLASRLDDADVLITSSRPSALTALGMSWSEIHERHPQLIQVAIVGYPGADAEVPGHDLTYQAANGTIDGRSLPRILVADLAGGERAAAAAMAGLIERGRTGAGSYVEVALSDVATDFSAPHRHGLTSPGGLLGGGIAQYNVYPSADGFVALAALESHFWAYLCEGLGVPADSSTEDLELIFAENTSSHWSDWARERDIPLVPCGSNL
ncbi:CoA transferase [Dietzia timorensis]|uniref:Uncharacterized protein YfdE n=1 Tax=Dietzia timorensis TaxID=499555 RepID=A0A173LIB9_9ACTN|nr:CaiB/BaiF CoA-transferase family protein [Dietzia timorensis]ANI91268.1 Uncharacterized protein YfdE [Dietzia timorensis]